MIECRPTKIDDKIEKWPGNCSEGDSKIKGSKWFPACGRPYSKQRRNSRERPDLHVIFGECCFGSEVLGFFLKIFIVHPSVKPTQPPPHTHLAAESLERSFTYTWGEITLVGFNEKAMCSRNLRKNFGSLVAGFFLKMFVKIFFVQKNTQSTLVGCGLNFGEWERGSPDLKKKASSPRPRAVLGWSKDSCRRFIQKRLD